VEALHMQTIDDGKAYRRAALAVVLVAVEAVEAAA
jgi:hypothetical protein